MDSWLGGLVDSCYLELVDLWTVDSLTILGHLGGWDLTKHSPALPDYVLERLVIDQASFICQQCDLELYKHLRKWARGLVGSWARELVGAWALAISDPWARGLVQSSARGLVGSWTVDSFTILGHLGG